MTRRQALALSLAGLAIPAGLETAIAQSPGAFPRTLIPTRTSLSRVGLEKGWSAVVPLGYGTERVLLINLAGDLIVAQTSMGFLHTYQAETGRYMWGTRLGPGSLDVRPASVNSDLLFTTSGTKLFCLDRATGRTVWETPMPATAVGATAANEHQVMVGLSDGKVVAYNIRDRTRMTPPGRSAGSFAWAWQTGGTLTARPIPTRRVTAFASQDGRVYVALDQPPKILYRYLTGGPIVGSMATYGTDTLIVPSMDQTLSAIDLYSGDTRWTVAGGAPFDQEPLVDRDRVIAINTAGRVLGIDAKSGEILRSADTNGGRLLSLSEKRLYMMTSFRDLIVYDRTAGRVLHSAGDTRERAGLNLRDYSLSVTNALNDRVYLGSSSGFLLALREAGQVEPRPLRDPLAPVFGTIQAPPDPEAEAPPMDTAPDEEPGS